MPLGRGARDQLDLAVVEPESRIDVAALRLHRTIVRQEDALRTAFDDGRRDRRPGDIGEALSREQHGYILLAQHLQPFPDARGERSEEQTSELQSLMRISNAVFCLKTKN